MPGALPSQGVNYQGSGRSGRELADPNAHYRLTEYAFWYDIGAITMRFHPRRDSAFIRSMAFLAWIASGVAPIPAVAFVFLDTSSEKAQTGGADSSLPQQP